MKKIYRLFLLFALCLLPLVMQAQKDGSTLHAGDTLPVFSLTLNNGGQVATDSLKGRPSLIAFFNTRCSDCRKELPVLQEIYEQWHPYIYIICVSRSESRESIEAFWSEHSLSLPFSAQEDRSIYSLFAQRGIPKLYISDSSGTICQMFSEKVSRRKLLKAIKAVTSDKK